MATTSSSPASPAELIKTISQNGFFAAEDPIVGRNIKQMDDDAIPFASIAGLRFYKANILDNPHIEPVLGSLFNSFQLGIYRSIGSRPPGIYTFESDPNTDTTVLLVQLWSSGSEVAYWKGSHKQWLDPVEGENSLLRVPRARLRQLGLRGVSFKFEQGGFAIIDDRTAFEVLRGTAITFAFGRTELVRTWSPMLLHRSLESTVTNMETEKSGMHVKYFE